MRSSPPRHRFLLARGTAARRSRRKDRRRTLAPPDEVFASVSPQGRDANEAGSSTKSCRCPRYDVRWRLGSSALVMYYLTYIQGIAMRTDVAHSTLSIAWRM